MKRLVSKKVFITIFSNLKYRHKLDKIVLNFFGLDTNEEISLNEITKEDITINIMLMINTEEILNIIVRDTKNLFNSSKNFYINFSYREVDKYHELLMPGYWEVYIPYSYKHLKENPKLLLIAALLYCENLQEVKNILKNLQMFNKNDIENILKIINQNI